MSTPAWSRGALALVELGVFDLVDGWFTAGGPAMHCLVVRGEDAALATMLLELDGRDYLGLAFGPGRLALFASGPPGPLARFGQAAGGPEGIPPGAAAALALAVAPLARGVKTSEGWSRSARAKGRRAQ